MFNSLFTFCQWLVIAGLVAVVVFNNLLHADFKIYFFSSSLNMLFNGYQLLSAGFIRTSPPFHPILHSLNQLSY